MTLTNSKFQWRLREPGCLELTGTKMAVLYDDGVFAITYRGEWVHACFSLDKAKSKAQAHWIDLMDIELEPSEEECAA